MIERILYLGPHNVEITNYPLKLHALFNAGAITMEDKLFILARGVFGYYSYASALVELEIKLEDLLNRGKAKIKELFGEKTRFEGRLAILPNKPYDLFGCEDPRLTVIDNEIYAVYTARLMDYPETGRVVPALARKENEKWEKLGYFKYPNPFLNDKNAFLIKHKGKYFLFHRTEEAKDKYRMLISKVDPESLELVEHLEVDFSSLKVDTKKIGWGTPPIKLGNDFLMFIHSVGAEDFVYRGHLLLMNKDFEVEAISKPVLEPTTIEEKFGDRPMVTFPTGFVRVDEETALVIYGAADSFVGIAKLDLTKIDELF